VARKRPIAAADAHAEDVLLTGAPSWMVRSTPALTARGERTRQKILTSARVLIEQRSYERIAVSDIAKRSRTSVGTFYRYFDSKESLLTSLLSACLWDMYQASRGSWDSAAPFLENVVGTTRAYLTAYYKNRLLMRSSAEAAQSSPQVRQLLTEMRRDLYGLMAARLQQDQALSPLEQLDPDLMMRALGAMVDGYAHRTFADEEFGKPDESAIGPAAEVLARVWSRAIFGADYQIARTSGPRGAATRMSDSSNKARVSRRSPAARAGSG